ncbi:unnamed protein product [Bathycoccus prasinos]
MTTRRALVAVRELARRRILAGTTTTARSSFSFAARSFSSFTSSSSSSSNVLPRGARTIGTHNNINNNNMNNNMNNNNKQPFHSTSIAQWKNHSRNTERLNPPERGPEAPMTSFEAGKKQKDWGKAGGGMSPFTKTRELKKRKTYEKRAGHMMETLERERITEMLNEREGVKISPFRPGDVVQLTMEVPENRRRTQRFTGICIARKNRGLGSSFTLRTMLGNVGVERMFPLYSPNIKELVVVERKRVRRAKLYYLRDRPARFSRVG